MEDCEFFRLFSNRFLRRGDRRPSLPDLTKPFLAVEVNPEVPPVASVIWMHGLGANGYDFASVPPQLGLPSELAVRYVFPHARAFQ